MREHAGGRPTLHFDVWTDPAMIADPHSAMRDMVRTMPPIFWTEANGGHWVTTDAALMEEVVRDYSRFTARGNRVPYTDGGIVMIPLNLDPPAHDHYRKILVRCFGSGAIKRLRPRIEEWAKKLVSSVADKGGCEFMDAIGSIFPVSIFMEMMGLPLSRLHEYRSIVVEYFSTTDNAHWLELQDQITRLMREVIDERIAQPRDDLITMFIQDRTDGRALTIPELEALCNQLFQAGMDTVANFAGFFFLFLASRPDLQDQLANDRALIPAAIEEGLRMLGLVNNARLAIADTELGGMRIGTGESVLCMLPFAGMDEKVNPDPGIFDLNRRRREYMIFSKGPHLCVGHNLARAEMQALVAEWVEQIPRFRLADTGRPVFRAGQVLAIDNLHLRWG